MNIDKIKIREILLDQQQELINQSENFSRVRSSSSELTKLVDHSKLVKVVLGIRRCGKSTLCKLALNTKSILYVNFDDERLIGITSSDLQTVLEVGLEITPNAEAYFFDEIQNIPSWELFINRLQRTKCNIVISGSNGKLLGQDLATHLTGREVSLTLYPLSFVEFVSWKAPEIAHESASNLATADQATLRALFTDYFSHGGFPDVVLGEPGGIYLRELFDRIITRDIVQRFKIRDVKILKQLASYLLQNSAQLVSFNRLKETFQLKSITTTRKYVQFLLDVFLVHEIQGYSYKLTERSTSARKTYACDVGMMSALWTKPSKDHGARLETVVALHFLQQKKDICYLRKEKNEVDFCVLSDGKPSELVQVCYDISDLKTREREFSALAKFGDEYQVKNLTVVTMDAREEVSFEGHTIQLFPAYLYLLVPRP